MALSFPTGHTHPSASHGTPRHARPCQCGPRALIEPDTLQCLRCGKYDKTTINATFAERARTIQLRARQRKAKAAA